MAAEHKVELKSAFDLFAPSIELLKKYLEVFFIFVIIPSLLMSFDSDTTWRLGPIAMVGGILALVFLAPSVYAEVRAAGGHSITLSESFKKGLPFFWRLLGLSLLVGLMVAVGLVLLVVPGLIIARRYILSPYYLVDRNLGISEAMQLSAKESKPVSGYIYSIIGVYLLIALLSIFGPLGAVATAILSALYGLALPIRYFEIKRLHKK